MKALRYSEILKPVGLEKLNSEISGVDFVIVSYPDDEGVRNNRGRGGADRGPERILYYLSRLSLHLHSAPKILTTTLSPSMGNLEERHQKAEAILKNLFQEKNLNVISIGGGHDYGFPDAAAYFQSFGGKILNLDAHLDLREPIDGKINSGTPFYRFAERFGGEALVEWGINPHSNSRVLFEYAKSNGIQYFSYDQEMPKISGSVGLSICLDAFQNIRAVSAPSVCGLDSREGLRVIKEYGTQSPWLGVYECAPDLDPPTEDSARLAALFISEYIHQRKAFDASNLF